MIPDLATGLASLSSGAGILALLGLICIWAWTLIIVTALNLREAKGAGGGTAELMREHEGFCRRLATSDLSARVRRRLLEARTLAALRAVAGSVPTVLVLASLAPLLGLLGTVEGMIETFRALAEQGNASNAALTSGVSQALVTTQGGLLVAIPSLLAGGLLHRKARKLNNRLRLTALRAEAPEGEATP